MSEYSNTTYISTSCKNIVKSKKVPIVKIEKNKWWPHEATNKFLPHIVRYYYYILYHSGSLELCIGIP